MKKLTLLLLFISLVSFGQNTKIKDFKITILSTMLSDSYIGEWGFSAIIEADGQRILFDTGSRENTVFSNAKELNINLDNIENVFLSHNHKDHTDVALDPYSSYGHDGVVENGLIVNDITNDILAKMSLTHIEAGARYEI